MRTKKQKKPNHLKRRKAKKLYKEVECEEEPGGHFGSPPKKYLAPPPHRHSHDALPPPAPPPRKPPPPFPLCFIKKTGTPPATSSDSSSLSPTLEQKEKISETSTKRRISLSQPGIEQREPTELEKTKERIKAGAAATSTCMKEGGFTYCHGGLRASERSKKVTPLPKTLQVLRFASFATSKQGKRSWIPFLKVVRSYCLPELFNRLWQI